jgi:outer membrane immunogenic protein
MKKSLLGMTVIAGLVAGGAAQAADMPIKAPARAPDCCVYANFGGWYIGFHGGGGVASDFGATLWDDGDEPLTARKRTFGLVGLHGGYNWQMGQAVVGIEGDYSWVNARNTITEVEAPNADVASAKLQSLASVRGRAGAVFGNLFVYGTAGWGWARTKFHFNDSDEPPALSISRTTSGVVGGVGVEWYLTKFGPGSLLLRSEWLHYAFGGQPVDHGIGGVLSDSFVTTKPPSSVDVVRAGLTWKFP